MKLELNKKKMKTLSADNNNIPAAMTPQVAGGSNYNNTNACAVQSAPTYCGYVCMTEYDQKLPG